MTLPDGSFVPFKMKGTTCCFETFCPSQQEIENYRHIALCDDQWDPLHHHFGSTKEEAEYDRLVSNVNISGAKVEFENNESEQLLSGVSTVYSEKDLLPKLVSRVQIARCTDKVNKLIELHKA